MQTVDKYIGWYKRSDGLLENQDLYLVLCGYIICTCVRIHLQNLRT